MARQLPNSINPKSMILNTAYTPDHCRQRQSVDSNPSTQDTLYFGTSFSPAATLAPSQLSFDPSLYAKSPLYQQSTSLESSLNLGTQAIRPKQVKRVHPRSPPSFIPNTNILHEPRVSPDLPWNAYDAAAPQMSVPTHHNPLDTRSDKKRPLTDSGYDTVSHRTTKEARYTSAQSTRGSIGRGRKSLSNNLPSRETQQRLLSPGHRRPRARSTADARSPGTLSTVTGADLDLTPAGSPPFHCQICGKTFDTNSEFSKDMARHDKRFKCEVDKCPRATEGFATKNDLERHRTNVHKDHDAREFWMCSVPDCKEPGKQWFRKDNFKAHIARMHKDQDPDTVIAQSYCGEMRPSSDSSVLPEESSNNAAEQPSYGQLEHGVQPSNDVFPNSYLSSLGTGLTTAPTSESWAEDSDLYGPPARHLSSSQSQQYQQNSPLNPNYEQNNYALSQPSFLPIPGSMPRLDYASSSSSGLPGTQRGQASEAFLSYRDRHGFQPSDIALINSYNMRVPYAHTAPPAQYTSDIQFQENTNWPQVYGAPTVPASDCGMSNVAGAGSWQVPSFPSGLTQHSEMTENLHMYSPAEMQPMEGGQVCHDRTAEMKQKIQAIDADAGLESYLDEGFDSMLEVCPHQPQVADSSKGDLTIGTASEDMTQIKNEERRFTCSREGCYRKFTQRNICRKHEQRHDRLFFCTFDNCDATFGSKADLRRHEERIHTPSAFEGWRCFYNDVLTSQHKPNCSRFFLKREEFIQHRRDEHKERAKTNNGGFPAVKNCFIRQGYPGQFWCGFCDRVVPNEPDGNDGLKCHRYRYDHIEQHIKKEGKRASDWVALVLH